MTTLHKAAQQALEALEDMDSDDPELNQEWLGKKAITALRAALAQEQAEPPTNQCGETCERAKLCAACARALEEPTGKQSLQVESEPVPQPGVWMHPWPPVRAQEPEPPPEAVTEAEKTAYAAGWWAAMAKGGGNPPPPLTVPTEVAATITTTDIAWLLTHRLTKIWQELGQMRWAGADEGWDRAIEAVRRRLDAECQGVLDWKALAQDSRRSLEAALAALGGDDTRVDLNRPEPSLNERIQPPRSGRLE